MSFFIFCLFVLAIICLIQGARKSSFSLVSSPKQHCAICGWTQEKVQPCQFELHQQPVVAPLCFDCCIKHDALPVRAVPVGLAHV
jgi:hypothetical protein